MFTIFSDYLLLLKSSTKRCQMNQLHSLDYVVFFIYFNPGSGYGYWVYRRKMYHQKKAGEMDSKDFFLAEGSLTWWAIGASLIASNISAEHFIGMSGSGFALGLAISSYEWMAAATLIIGRHLFYSYLPEE
jgi:SSS family solute:Na+ symporter